MIGEEGQVDMEDGSYDLYLGHHFGSKASAGNISVIKDLTGKWNKRAANGSTIIQVDLGKKM